MFHAPTSETKQKSNSSRTQLQQRADFSARAPSVPDYAPMHGERRLAFLHNAYGNQAVLRMLSRSGVDEENTQPATPGKGIDGRGGEQAAPLDKPDAGAPADDRPKQKVSMINPVCGKEYGATAKYCYDIPTGWWFKETVSMGQNTCGGGVLSVQDTPYQNPGTCIKDTITNTNGPPSKRAPCKVETNQTVLIGPTLDKLGQYKYANTQVIEVGLSPKKVTTSSNGVPAECDWS